MQIRGLAVGLTVAGMFGLCDCGGGSHASGTSTNAPALANANQTCAIEVQTVAGLIQQGEDGQEGAANALGTQAEAAESYRVATTVAMMDNELAQGQIRGAGDQFADQDCSQNGNPILTQEQLTAIEALIDPQLAAMLQTEVTMFAS